MKLITILIPCFNEEKSLPFLHIALQSLLFNNPGYRWEILFVDDGSKDNTLQIIKELCVEDPRFSYVSLSRNFGKERAMLAGFDYASGDCMIIMDADLQHPPELIPEMLKYWEEGWQDVYARRQSRKTDPWLRRKLSSWYYSLLQRLTREEILQDVGDFRLLDRKCIDALKQLRESERYTKGMYCWIGFKKKEILFEPAERVAGQSSFSFRRLLSLAMEGFTSYTTAPLRISTAIGVIVSLLSFILMLVYILKALIYGDPVKGFPTLITVILFLGGIQLLSLGIIGEYLGRIFIESKNRPVYLVKESNIANNG